MTPYYRRVQPFALLSNLTSNLCVLQSVDNIGDVQPVQPAQPFFKILSRFFSWTSRLSPVFFPFLSQLESRLDRLDRLDLILSTLAIPTSNLCGASNLGWTGGGKMRTQGEGGAKTGRGADVKTKHDCKGASGAT